VRNTTSIAPTTNGGSVTTMDEVESRIFVPKNSRQKLMSTETILVKNRVSTMWKRRIIFGLLFTYAIFLYAAYKAYSGTLAQRVKHKAHSNDCYSSNYITRGFFDFFGLAETDLAGLSALHWAAIHNDPKVAEELISMYGIRFDEYAKKAPLDWNVRRIDQSEFSLFYLIFFPFTLLEKYYKRRLRDYAGDLSKFEGITPLHCAAWSNSGDMVDWLLARGDVDLEALDSAGHNAFGMAVKQCNFALAKKISNKMADFDVNARSFQGYTLLHEAAADGNVKTCKFLVENGADLAICGPCGQTAAGWCEDRQYKLHRDETNDSRYVQCLYYLESVMEEKGLLPKYQINDDEAMPTGNEFLRAQH